MMSPLLTRQSQHSCWYGLRKHKGWERCGRGAQTCTHMVFVSVFINNLAYIPTRTYPQPPRTHINSVSCTCPLQHPLKPHTSLMKMLIVILARLLKLNKYVRICSSFFFFFFFSILLLNAEPQSDVRRA